MEKRQSKLWEISWRLASLRRTAALCRPPGPARPRPPGPCASTPRPAPGPRVALRELREQGLRARGAPEDPKVAATKHERPYDTGNKVVNPLRVSKKSKSVIQQPCRRRDWKRVPTLVGTDGHRARSFIQGAEVYFDYLRLRLLSTESSLHYMPLYRAQKVAKSERTLSPTSRYAFFKTLGDEGPDVSVHGANPWRLQRPPLSVSRWDGEADARAVRHGVQARGELPGRARLIVPA